jgi:CRP-like cAMP-binding protein
MGRALPADQKIIRNRILAGLSADDFARLRPHLEAADLPVRKMLEGRNRRIDHVWFLESGIASVVVAAGSQHMVEAGVIGAEGMTGSAVIMAAGRTPNETFMQSGGAGWRIATTDLVSAMDDSALLRSHLFRHAHVFQVQTSFTALANARYKMEERLARWLLMAQDRVGPDIALTHEFLALMLGVRRPGVTTAMNELEKRNILRATRGAITIMDRAALEDAANGSYGVPEAEYERLFGPA